jgi:endonuclease VIII
MPEGPEVWREARAIGKVLEGQKLQRAQFEWPSIAQHASALRSVSVLTVRPRGKAMTIAFSTGMSLVTHNQLYGEWIVAGKAPAIHRKALRILLESKLGVAMLYSATDIDWMCTEAVESHAYVAKLGPDALNPTTTIESVRERITNKPFRNRSLASLLLDQGFVAGLGNYLRSDILFMAGVRAELRPNDCTKHELDALAEAIVALPRQSLASGGITNDPSLASDLKSEGWPFARYRHWVFDREGESCHVCATRIERAVVGGRNVFFCTNCQRG